MIYFAERNDKKIFMTGAFLQPMKVKDSVGKDLWIWTVEKFEDSSFYNGKEYNPVEIAENLEKLIGNREH